MAKKKKRRTKEVLNYLETDEAQQSVGQYETDILDGSYEQTVSERVAEDGVIETIIDYDRRPTTATFQGFGKNYKNIDWTK